MPSVMTAYGVRGLLHALLCSVSHTRTVRRGCTLLMNECNVLYDSVNGLKQLHLNDMLLYDWSVLLPD